MAGLEDYHDEVRAAIAKRDGTPLLEGNTSEAAIIVHEAFKQAQHRISILSYRLDPDCYATDAVRRAARCFLAKDDRRVEVLIESSLWDPESKYNWHEHPFILELKSFLGFPSADRTKPGLYVRFVPATLAQTYECNFLLMDDFGYRFEATRTQEAAVAAFFSVDAAEKDKPLQNLEDIFARLWENSTPLAREAPSDSIRMIEFTS